MPRTGQLSPRYVADWTAYPLAIELAPARVVALGPGEIAAHLDERFRLLTGGRRRAVERQHTLRATIDWSYSLLAKRDREVFNCLGVFPSSFDLSAAQAVAAAGGVEAWDVLDALTGLVAKSLLNADRSGGGPTRYQMLESLRHYARERLEGAGGADESRRCHGRHYAAVSAETSSGLRSTDEPAWRRCLAADLDNLRAAVDWALDSEIDQDTELALVILGELSSALFGGTMNFFAGVDYEQATERARRLTSRYASLVLASAALDAYSHGDFRRGRDLSREAVQGVRTSPLPSAVLNVKLMFAHPGYLESELTDSLRLLDGLGADPWDYAEVHAAAAGMAAALGDVPLARREVAVALEMGRRFSNPTTFAIAQYASGLASWQSDPVGARAALEEHVEIVRKTGYSGVVGRVLALLAQLQAGAGELSAAVGTLHEAIESAHVNGDRPAVAVCLTRGAVVMAALGDIETVVVFLGAVADGVFSGLTVLPATEVTDHEKFIAAVRSEMGEDRFRVSTTRGASMTYEEITAFALTAVKGSWPTH